MATSSVLGVTVTFWTLLLCIANGSSQDVPLCKSDGKNDLSQPRCGGYLISLPRVIIRNSTTNVCFTFHDITRDVKVKLSLKITTKPETHEHEETFSKGVGRCIQMLVPDFISRRHAELKAEVTVMTSPPQVLPPTTRNLRVIIRNILAFIQTDKPIYLPDSIANIRIFAMHMNFTPSHEPISMVTVRNSDGYVVQQWQDVETRKGIADLQLQISSHTTLGQWRITATVLRQEFVATFNVIEYVLPKFEVTLDAPKTMNAEDDELDVRLCAQYVYGQPVKGLFIINACSGPFCQTTSGSVSGCKVVAMTTPINHVTTGVLMDSLKVTANVTDVTNGETLVSEVQIISISKASLNLDLQSHSPAYFKPFIDYHGKVTATHLDGSPASGVALTIKVFHTGDPPESILRERNSLNVTSDSKGIALFTLPALSSLVDSFKIRVTEIHSTSGWQEQETVLQVRRWHSPTGSYIHAPPISNLPECATDLRLNVSYIWSHKRPQNVTLYTQLMTNNGLNSYYQQKQVFLWPALSLAPDPMSNALSPYSDQDKLEIGAMPQVRHLVDKWKHFVIIPNPHTTIGYYGYITQWRFFSVRSMKPKRMRFLNSDKVFLQVWRPINSKEGGSHSSLQLVGQTPASYTNKGMYAIELEGRQRIKVHQGDVLGLYLPRRNPIPFNAKDCVAGEVGLVIRNPSRMDIGETYDFRNIKPNKYLPCRDYSVQATIQIDGSIEEALSEILPRHFDLNLSFDQPITGQSVLLFYYITPEGETVADSVKLPTDTCLPHKVEVNFTSNEGYPGETVGYDISGEPGSLCALSMVDKSVQLLQKHEPINKDLVYGRRQVEVKNKIEPIERKCDEVTGSLLADSLEAFEDSGLTVITNMAVENRPCGFEDKSETSDIATDSLAILPPGAAAIDSNEGTEYGGEVIFMMEDIFEMYPALAKVVQRFYFPETWLWHLHDLGPTGKISASKDLPHSITTWQGSSVCMNDVTGLGISKDLHIKAFQPFFLSVTAPFSVINTEFLEVKLTVNNYLEQCFELTVEMEPPARGGFALVNGSDHFQTCLCGKETQTFTYHLQALSLGKHDLRFSARTGVQTGFCNTTHPIIEAASDSISKPVIIKAEGIEDEYAAAELLCPTSFDQEITQSFNLSLPRDFVKGSEIAQLDLIADVMGPTLLHAHKLLKGAIGTGEHTAARLAVNVIALEYLQMTSQLTEKHRKKALRLIESGYQQQLAFRRRDGSYSNLGSADEVGSLWLTAFVIRTFALVRRHMYVDYSDFEQSVGWIKSKQDFSGCFMPIGMVHSRSLKGGMQEANSHVPLTAYVIASLLQAGASKFDPIIDTATRCLETETPEDIYSLATLAYAFSVYDGDDFRVQRYLDKVRNLRIKEGGYEYWKVDTEEKDFITPLDIETTSYILSAILARGRRQDIMEGSRIVRWLANQRSSKGGFKSTQDTVMAVEALSKYASLTYLQNIDMKVELVSGAEDDTPRKVEVKTETRLVVNQWIINDLPKRVKVKVTGMGCLLVQTSVAFNRAPVLKMKPEFSVDINVAPMAHHRFNEEHCPRYKCWHRRLEICAKYTGPRSNAAITYMEISMVSGWTPAADSLSQLRSQTEHYHSHTHRSFQDGKLIIMFGTVPSSNMCIELILEQRTVVKFTKNAIIRVFEINNEHRQASLYYGIEEVCSKEEENMACLPHQPELEWSP